MVFSELKNPVFYRKTLHIMIPVMLQSLISVGVNFLDNIMIGQLGQTAISGVSLSTQFYSIFLFIFMGIGSGANVISSQYWGAKRYDSMKVIAATVLRIAFVISALFLAVTAAFPRGILGIYTNNQGIIDSGYGYLRLLACTFIFYGLCTTVTTLLRSTGHVKIPLISSIIAFFLNLFFNWVFIFGKFGAPALGVIGAAVGTVIARTFEFLFICGYFILFEKNFGYRLKHAFLRDRSLTRQYVRFSLPVMISDTLLGIGLSLTGVIVGHMAEEFITAHSIVNSGNHLITVTNTAMAAASAVIIGNTIGEGDKDRAYREGVAYIVIALLLGALFSLIIFLLKGPYLTLYSVSDDARAVCMELFRYLIYFSPLEMLAYCVSKGVLRGSGDTRFLMVADIILLWAISLPLGYLAAHVWKMAPFWVYFFLKLEYAGKGLLCTARFLSKKGIKVVG